MLATIDQMEQYFNCQFVQGDWIEVRAIWPDRAANRPAQKRWHRIGDVILSDLAYLHDWNQQGWNIYVGANPRKDNGLSGDENITVCRSLFCDFDHVDAPDGMSPGSFVSEWIDEHHIPTPSMLVNSGHGVHAYWQLIEPMRPDAWRLIQQRLIACLQSDSAIHNPERIMRLPGTSNTKTQPWLPCFVIYCDLDVRYDVGQIEKGLPILKPDLPLPSGPRPTILEAKGRALLYAAKWEAVSEGQRNQLTFAHACQLLNDFILDARDAWEIVCGWNRSNLPPLDERELSLAFESAKVHAKRPKGNKLAQPVTYPTKQSKTPVDENETVRPVFVWMQDVESKPVRWLWQNRVPSAMLSLLIGVEGSGKTFAALDLAARITTGRSLPGGGAPYDVAPVGNVVFLTSEDHLSFTVRPRLDAMGADPARIVALKGVKYPEGDTDFFDVMRHLPALELLIQEAAPVSLVIVDPLTAFLGRADQHKNGEVRVALARFNALAERHGCAVLGISHLSKDVNRMAIHRTIGSVAFSASARAIWLVCADQEDPDRKLFVPVKSNLARLAKSLAFRIEGMALQWDDGEFEYEADQVLAVSREEPGALADACEWLEGVLADGKVRSSDVWKMAAKEKIVEKTLRRAKAKLGVDARKHGIGSESFWYWELPKKVT